ncbi:hypothetical protein KIPB_014034, partial [Kipferlia bialata]|eukprot:g14034.t1
MNAAKPKIPLRAPSRKRSLAPDGYAMSGLHASLWDLRCDSVSDLVLAVSQSSAHEWVLG